MDFDQLKFIVEAVETGSISKAANNLFVSQPNLSRQITNLENEIGKKIFNRTNRGVTLTSYGVEVYKNAKAMVEEYKIVEKKLLTNVNDNKIKIASFGSEIVNSQFFEVCRRYNKNNYVFEIYECGVEEAIEKVSNRDCNIGIIIYSDYQLKKLSRFLVAEELELINLFNGQLKIHVSNNSHLSEKETLTKEDLHELFHVKKSYLFEGIFGLDYELEHLGIPDNKKAILTNGNKTYNDALHNLPSFAVEIDWKCNKTLPSDLVRIPFADKTLDITCAMVKRRNEILKDELVFLTDKLVEAYS